MVDNSYNYWYLRHMPPFKYDTEKFIEICSRLHDNQYDYSKSIYIDYKTKLTITCKIHGDFEQTPNKHFNGQGCFKCGKLRAGKMKRSNLDKFIEKSKLKHGDKYDYSKVVYKTTHEKVIIICPKHGEFEQVPSSHQRGCGCPCCYEDDGRGASQRLNTEEFIRRSREIHGDKFDYSKTVYTNSTSKLIIICPKHGEFEQVAGSHMVVGHGCRKCNYEDQIGRDSLTTDEFIQRAKEVHGDKFDYSKSIYIDWETNLTITCKKHGDFEQLISVHLGGCGCPRCQNSRGANRVERELENHGLKYVREKWFPTCRDKAVLRFDFWIPELNLLIEYDGIQHFPEEYKLSKLFREKYIPTVEGCVRRDKIKDLWCVDNCVNLLRIKYNADIKVTISEYLKFLKEGL